MLSFKYNDFVAEFRRLSLRDYHHSDVSEGARYNFVARMLEGEARIEGGELELSIEPGDLFFIPMGLSYHSYWWGERMVWDSLAFTFLPGEAVYPLQKCRSSAELDAGFERLFRESESSPAMLGHAYTLIGRVFDEMKSDRLPRDSLVEHASSLLSENPSLPIPEIARRCQVSESGLYAAFRQLGTTPVRARLEAQVRSATTLLSTTDLTVEVISERCGFGSATYFYRTLKRLTGKSSRDFRRGGIM